MFLKSRLSRFNAQQPDVSLVVPCWNEEKNIFHMLSSFAYSNTKLKIELIIVNNNSTDDTQKILDELGVRTIQEPTQGITFARRTGMAAAKGKYYLCGDADSLYPESWIDEMVTPMILDKNITGVYGRYSFLPEPKGVSRLAFYLYESLTGMMVRLRKVNKEHLNVFGFNMGYVTSIGQKIGPFDPNKVRKFDNARNSEYYVDESEDGRMAIHLMQHGKLKMITAAKARVYTSARKINDDGGVLPAFKNRFYLHLSRSHEYLFGKA